MMGWRINQFESQKILSTACDYGVNFIDSSVSYSRGYCHKIIGKALSNLKIRDEFIIATKVGGISDDNDPAYNRGYSKRNIIRQCELSLKQLNIEKIDILQLHYPAEEANNEEMLEALTILLKQGKIDKFGVCNYDKNELNAFCESAVKNNYQLPISNQFEFNLLNYKNSQSLFDACISKNLGTITWGPLSSGLLTDWYSSNTKIKPKSRLYHSRERELKFELLEKPTTKEKLLLLSKLSKDTGVSSQLLAVSWILNKKPDNCVLIGPSNKKQLVELVSGNVMSNHSIISRLNTLAS